ncbi:hypothetical protein THTE_0180 [Thermogutta terrifontis]|uniref:Uncharacterized protein n=1 Tax=Thermogutta terrifontis TaxID=1331910 RepID=A0A286R9Z1_9BACT|nr:hypothetical protein THTE_0180 [Thermogutta terrifontis]
MQQGQRRIPAEFLFFMNAIPEGLVPPSTLAAQGTHWITPD